MGFKSHVSFVNSGEGVFDVPLPENEPITEFGPGSKEKILLKNALSEMSGRCIDIPCIIGGKEIFTGNTQDVVMPHNHGHVLAKLHLASEKECSDAADAASEAWHSWSSLPWQERVSVILRAADLLAGPFRNTINASTMLGQSKSVYQSEIDAVCELIDFYRFNCYFYRQILQIQPKAAPTMWNRTDYRPLEGFVLAITPFNFTSIGGNLTGAPVLVGNTVVWKPSRTAALSSYYLMKLYEAAGLPPGVINFIPAEGKAAGRALLSRPDLAAVNFTGSTSVFRNIIKTVGEGIDRYKNYPRLIGETGGKDFIFAHRSADPDALVTAAIRGAFEYQGQKCSAASRMYVPKSLWPSIKERLIEELKTVKVGEPTDFSAFMNAVIDKRSFDNIGLYLEHAKNSNCAKIIVGGETDCSKGYFVRPTIIETDDPNYKSIKEEIFGPVLTVFPYDDDKFEETINLCDTTTPYGLTGGIFCRDRTVIHKLTSDLRFSAGNFYVNDKPTGAVVGQQPFGGARASGTNDKAGSAVNLYRFLSPRTIKENLNPPKDWRYPFMSES